MYICDSTNAEKDYKFPLPLKDVHPDDIWRLSFTVSHQNEIICIFSKYSDKKSLVMYIITIDGKIKLEAQVPRKTGYVCSTNVVFNHVNKTILVSLYSCRDEISLFVFSKTGELLYDFKIPGWNYHQLTSHPNGPIALVDNYEVKMFQM